MFALLYCNPAPCAHACFKCFYQYSHYKHVLCLSLGIGHTDYCTNS